MYPNCYFNQATGMLRQPFSVNSVPIGNMGKPVLVYQNNDYFCVCVPKVTISEEEKIVHKPEIEAFSIPNLNDFDVSFEDCSLSSCTVVIKFKESEIASALVSINPETKCGEVSVGFKVDIGIIKVKMKAVITACIRDSRICVRVCLDYKNPITGDYNRIGCLPEVCIP